MLSIIAGAPVKERTCQLNRRVAVIPARGGSKRIPRKNIKPFLGRPIIVWSIMKLKSSGLFDRVIVSTDDEEIAGISKSAGAEVPFLRPVELADDFTDTREVIKHAINAEAECRNSQVDYSDLYCCVYPTAPLLNVERLREGLSIIKSEPEIDGKWDFVVSVSPLSLPIQRTFQLNEDKGLKMFFPENFKVRSQDLPPAYFDAGQFYWARASAWTGRSQIFGPRSRGIIIPSDEVEDIDTPEDWRRAEEKALALNSSSFEVERL